MKESKQSVNENGIRRVRRLAQNYGKMETLYRPACVMLDIDAYLKSKFLHS